MLWIVTLKICQFYLLFEYEFDDSYNESTWIGRFVLQIDKSRICFIEKKKKCKM